MLGIGLFFVNHVDFLHTELSYHIVWPFGGGGCFTLLIFSSVCVLDTKSLNLHCMRIMYLIPCSQLSQISFHTVKFTHLFMVSVFILQYLLLKYKPGYDMFLFIHLGFDC